MKKFILCSLTILLMSTSVNGQVFQYVRLYIDPGHGGPGAEKYVYNGYGHNNNNGAVGPYYELTEQWINLQVALQIKYLTETDWNPLHWFIIWEYVGLSRYIDTTDVSLRERADSANAAEATHFISIHHNGFEVLADQGTEVYWYNATTTGSPDYLPRDTTYLLAQKILFQLRDTWHYKDRCSLFCDPQVWGDCTVNNIRGCMTCWDVLRYSTMASALSEASDISQHSHEEYLFNTDPDGDHIEEEAKAIFDGLCSFINNGGIAKVENRWIGGGGGLVKIDDVVENSPYVTCWEADEMHTMEAASGYYFDGYSCAFYHWKQQETGNIWDQLAIYIQVPRGESTHTYTAYYTGGPYSANLFMPDGGDTLLIGDEELIIWGIWVETSLGVDSTTLIDVYLDRNSGQDGYPETLFTDLPRKDYSNVPWEVTDPPSNNCRIKIVAEDCVENTATDASSYDFIIRFPNVVGDVNTDGSISNADVVYLINYLYKHGPPPDPFWKAGVNSDCQVSLSDIVYLINYLFKGGPPPEECDPGCDGAEWDCNR